MREQTGRHWLVFVAATCFVGGSIGVLVNCTGIIFTAIISEFGFRSGDLSIYYTIRGLMQALSVAFVVKTASKKPRLWLPVIGVTAMLCFVTMPFYTQLWHWYASAVVAGICMSCPFVLVPVIINNWFKKNNGMLIGIAMGASGLAGAVLSPVLSNLIAAHGWRFAVVFQGLLGGALMALPSLLWAHMSPDDLGLKPYGYTESAMAGQASVAGAGGKSAVPGYIFLVSTRAILMSMLTLQFMNQIPLFATSIGYTLTVGAMMSSCNMIGNVTGKTLFGIAADRIGAYRTTFLFLGVIGASTLVFIFGQGSAVALYVACLMFGFSFSMSSTAPALIYPQIYGDDYKGKLSGFQAANNILVALSSSLIPYIYDFTGSFTPVFVIAALGVAGSVAGFVFVINRTKKVRA